MPAVSEGRGGEQERVNEGKQLQISLPNRGFSAWAMAANEAESVSPMAWKPGGMTLS